MTDTELVQALSSMSVETGSLACLGCGYEHNCGVHGCAIMRAAADRLAACEDICFDTDGKEHITAEALSALVKAQDEGRVVVLPCKVGDTMYSSTLGQLKPFTVAGFEFYGADLIAVEQRGTMREHRRIGKEAHATRAEAEAALHAQEGDSHETNLI